jgi:hypothetical protein
MGYRSGNELQIGEREQLQVEVQMQRWLSSGSIAQEVHLEAIPPRWLRSPTGAMLLQPYVLIGTRAQDEIVCAQGEQDVPLLRQAKVWCPVLAAIQTSLCTHCCCPQANLGKRGYGPLLCVNTLLRRYVRIDGIPS